jgi:hypothetical protein
MNGTSAQALYDGAEAAYNALQEAQRLLCEAAPNGRDYYPQGPQAFYGAQDEHFNRLQRLQSVMAELEGLMGHLSNAMVKR